MKFTHFRVVILSFAFSLKKKCIYPFTAFNSKLYSGNDNSISINFKFNPILKHDKFKNFINKKQLKITLILKFINSNMHRLWKLLAWESILNMLDYIGFSFPIAIKTNFFYTQLMDILFLINMKINKYMAVTRNTFNLFITITFLIIFTHFVIFWSN